MRVHLAVALLALLGGLACSGSSSFQGAVTPGTGCQCCTLRSADGPSAQSDCGGTEACNGPEDCTGGTVCCVLSYCGNLSGYETKCVDSCPTRTDCVGTDGPSWRLCLTDADCPGGGKCVASSFGSTQVKLTTNAGVCR